MALYFSIHSKIFQVSKSIQKNFKREFCCKEIVFELTKGRPKKPIMLYFGKDLGQIKS